METFGDDDVYNTPLDKVYDLDGAPDSVPAGPLPDCDDAQNAEGF